MKTLNKAKFIIGEENKKSLFFLFFINIFVFILEFLSIVSIPIFTSVLLDTNLFLDKYFFLKNQFIEDNFLIFASLFVISTFLLKNLFLLYGKYITHSFLKKLKVSLSTKLFNFYFQSSLLRIQLIKPSIMYRNVVNEMVGVEAFLINLNKFVLEISATFIIFIILLSLNPQISVGLIIVFSSITFFYFRFIRPSLKRKAKENQTFIANFNKSISETFEAIKDIKIFQKEKEVSNIFKKDVVSFESNMFFFKIFETLPKILLEIISIFAILIISLLIFSKSSQTNNFIEYIPTLVLIIVSCIRLIPAFSGINVSLFYLRVYARSIDVIFNQIKNIETDKNLNNKQIISNSKIFKKDLDINKNFLVIDNISFSYDTNKLLLDKINLVIPKKGTVAITGKTGSGKSTLQHIMMGLIKPDKGNIYFENKNINTIYKEWLSKIGYVSQKVFLLDDTIEKNICLNFDNKQIDKKRLDQAIKIAELNEKISSFGNKLLKEIGTDGISLSGGERQRIAIARAVYKKSEILFLDEFTSSLDNKTQEKIINNLKINLPEVTIVMISHRTEITHKCDLVIKLGEE